MATVQEQLAGAILARNSLLNNFKQSATQLERFIVDPKYNLEDAKDLFAVVQHELYGLERADAEVLKAMIAAKCSEAEYLKEDVDIHQHKRIGLAVVNKADRSICRREAEAFAASSRNIPMTPGGANKKLPKLDLPKFSGEIRDWLPFWSQFREIDEDMNISDSDKFQYLIQSTVPDSEAREVVMSFPVCAENYNLAVNQLLKMYGREKMLVKVYIRDLLKLVIDNAQNKKISLSSLYFKLSAKLKALETLKVTTDKCASVIYPLVESCLPEEVLRTWQRHPTCQSAPEGEELPKLIEFLEGEVGSENNIRLACDGLKQTEIKEASNKQQGSKRKGGNGGQIATATDLLAVGNERKKSCIFCDKKNHDSELCWNASSMPYDTKDKMVKDKRACFKCLRLGHRSENCKAFVKCLICGMRHQTVMCKKGNSEEAGSAPPPSPQVQQQAQAADSSSKTASTSGSGFNSTESLSNQEQNPMVVLQTLSLKVHGANGSLKVRALVDTGSERSYITKCIAERVGLPALGTELVIHKLFGGSTTKPVKHIKYKILLSDLNNGYSCRFDVLDTEQITDGKVKRIPRGPWLKELREKKIVVSDVGDQPSEIDVLIGGDVAAKLLTGNKYDLMCGPVAVQLKLGWTLMGKLLNVPSTSDQTLTSLSMSVRDCDVTKLWELDVIGIMDPTEKKTREELEESAMQHFKNTVTQNDDGRYEVNLPWIEEHSPLPTNRNVAERRLRSTTANLIRDGTLSNYDELFKMWEQSGMIEEVPENEIENYGHYLPHRAVYKPSSETTPIRPVFDASCKLKGQPSLNDCLEKGPNLLELIPTIITRFRMNAVGVVADIKKAFQQISVCKKDRDFLRFLWWRDLTCSEIKVYRHCRVVFGVSSSPFILGATLNHIIDNVSPELGDTAETLKKSLYVDNVATSVNTMEAAEKFKSESEALLQSSMFELRGWEIGPKSAGDISGIGSLSSRECGLDIGSCEEKQVPLLGMNWGIKNDVLSCDLSQIEKRLEGAVTKRKILSLAHTVYDPVGFTVPYTIIPKQLLQETWPLKLGWDSALPTEIVKKFELWSQQLHLLKDLQIPRWVATVGDKSKWSLHVFVDASKKSYAACVFLRIEDQGATSVHLLQAKSRVAPLKELSITRLELLSCLIGARLGSEVRKMIEFEDIPTWYWTDSSTALWWIKKEGNWGVFLQRRVEEIRKLCDITHWRHIPGENNPADLPSRGCNLQQLKNSKWWEGPAWLRNSEDDWPRSEVVFDQDEINKEKRKTVVSAINRTGLQLYEEICQCENYEDMTQRMSQALPNCLDEVRKAEKALLKLVQDAEFNGVKDEKLMGKSVFQDEDKIIRLKTRLVNGDFDDNFRLPIVLPPGNPVVEALILHEHKKNAHAGIQTLQAMLREQYWILKSRRTIRNVLNKCEVCQRYAAKKTECEAAPLPKERLQAEVPFQITGVDMMGPLYLKDGRKAWVALFTCAVYRAVHLELVTSLSTQAFKNALRCFVGRRGKPSIIYSDNGTNFVGTHNAFKAINWKQVEKYGNHKKITWRFNPPTAAWWGGFWERMVRAVKQTLRKVLGKSCLDFDELRTMLCDVESIINQRPLTYVSEDPADLEPLTPFIFLTGNKSGHVPEADAVDDRSLEKKWRYIQRLREDLRSRFRKEYLGQLEGVAVKKETPKLEVGDKVLIGSDNTKRLDWPMGTIVELIYGRDGKNRVVKVKTADGVLLRPVQRIYQLEVKQEKAVSSLVKPGTSKQTDQRVETVTKSGRRVKIPSRLTYIDFVKCI